MLQTMLRRDPTGFCRNVFSRATHRFAEGSFLPTDLLFFTLDSWSKPNQLEEQSTAQLRNIRLTYLFGFGLVFLFEPAVGRAVRFWGASLSPKLLAT